VHDLLAESGLGQFYDLSSHPGVRIKPAAQPGRWDYLDEPSLQHQLLDFTEGNVSCIRLHIPAIHCVACVWLLENLFRLHTGIAHSQVNFPKREVSIRFASNKIALSELLALLTSIGYEPQLTLGELEKPKASRSRQRQWLQIGVAGFAFGNIMLFSIPAYLGMDSLSAPLFKALFGYLSLALAVPVLTYSASDYWRSALLSVRQRVLTLDVPIALGLAALYTQSAYEILLGAGDGYLDSMAGLIFFLLCGKVFQKKTHDRLAFDRDYRCFFPLSVFRKTPSGEESIALSQLRVNDLVMLRHGELIPADSRLMSSEALIDYSFVTGESEPVAKQAGDYLYAGGQQLGSIIEIETLKAVSQSYLTSLWNHDTFKKVRDENLNTLTNGYSRRFTRIVIGIAVGAGLFWMISGETARGLKALSSVLIVACPCALALAAPFAQGAVQRLLARVQVFVRNGFVLERMAQVDAIVFDKTGTLTESAANEVMFHRETLESRARQNHNQTEETWIYSVARHSTHPHAVRISEALARRCEAQPVRSFVETPGRGIEGQIGEHEIWLGSKAWLQSRGLLVPEIALPPGSAVCVAIDRQLCGTFIISNPLRARTERLLARLRDQYEIALLSGDNEKERERFRSFFGNDTQLNFNQSPIDKLGFIRDLQNSGRTVMMVGDGLNDAGALKQSDVGVAVVEKIGVFSPASDVILAAHQVPNLFEILLLARKTTSIVRVSFLISALYNLVGISIAAAGLLSPIVCAILMPVSSVSVVLFACGATNCAARKVGVVKSHPASLMKTER
jgi:P-type Cu+ transporter